MTTKPAFVPTCPYCGRSDAPKQATVTLRREVVEKLTSGLDHADYPNHSRSYRSVCTVCKETEAAKRAALSALKEGE